MNSRDRVIKAFKREIPDRVPHFELIIDKRILNKIIPGINYFDFVDEYDIDGVTIKFDNKIIKIEDKIFKDERGLLLRETMEEYKIPVNTVIKNEADLKKFEFPDPNAEYRFSTLKKAVEKFKNKRAIIVRLKDGWSEARDLHGYENTLMDLIDNPNLIRNIIEKAVDYYSELGRLAAKIGADIAFSGDDISGINGMLMSPYHFKEIIYPAMKRLYKNWHSYGLFVLKHSDGNLNDIMDLLIETGLDCLNPIDPLAGMSLEKIKIKYGHKICLMGNVNCAGNLVYGSKEDVIKEVLNCIKVASYNGGYILSSSNSIHSSVNPANYIAMIEAVKKYGIY